MLNLLKSGEGFTPPGTKDFDLPSFFNNSPYFTKPILELFLAVILISVFFILASRKAAVVPSKLQFAGESIYGFVRKGLGEDIIGPEFMRFVPFLFTLFTFILVNNLFGIVPLLQFPAQRRDRLLHGPGLRRGDGDVAAAARPPARAAPPRQRR